MTRRVERVETDGERTDALAVRRAVFVDEQGVPEALERDEYDEHDATVHFVAFEGDTAIGAARIRPSDDSGTRAKVERVAVLAEHRGEGVGAALMDAVETATDEEGFETLVLHAQTAVEGFYAKRGYETVGDEFEEAGIAHVEMVREV